MKTRTAVIYARVSSTNDRQNTERQVKDLTDYATANHLQVVEVFEEKISGAKANSERKTLQEALEYCKCNRIDILLSNEMSRIGRSTFNVMETIKFLIDNRINLYLQKEHFTLLNEDGKPSPFAAIMLATLSTCAELERENIQYRLNSGRRLYVERGGRLGRPVGSKISREDKETQYREVLNYLRKGYGVRITAKLTSTSESTVGRLKKEFDIHK